MANKITDAIKKRVEGWSSDLDKLLSRITQARQEVAQHQQAADQAAQDERAALQELEAQQERAIAARIDQINREVIAPAAAAVGQCEYQVDKTLFTLAEQVLELEFAMGRQNAAFQEACALRADLAARVRDSGNTEPVPGVTPPCPAYTGGLELPDGRYAPSGGLTWYVRERLLHLMNAGLTENGQTKRIRRDV